MSKRDSFGERKKGSSHNGSSSIPEQSSTSSDHIEREESSSCENSRHNEAICDRLAAVEETSKKPKLSESAKKTPIFKNTIIPKKGIQMKLHSQKFQAPSTVKKQITVASVFNDDDDSEPEEMPPEARMRMRNIGRETPTSTGPNSYGKTKQGFCDAKHVFEKGLKKAMDSCGDSK